ncbi:hypothetical protein ISN45_At05g048200 [Arabidopsis thaliana x Arabidopsis arenosa]|uniref:Uncharacterized protein n=1 Tax=Arabidopsis thaliana x Arabidopsis arenosa TaxID=1240361 RepID=A0A8T2DFD5_9BRAS|nr:hypothetical protein ISN45_At05g048200 [Arabidopsis thaliana x Arabidopsis arenosa]
MDVSDENIKREAMKIVWMYSGVTFVDIKEKGILKVKGKFQKIQMGGKLYEIDKSVDIINPTGKPGKSYMPGLNTVYNYVTTPKMQEILIFKFEVLNEHIIQDAMEVIWEFSGTYTPTQTYVYIKPNKSMIVGNIQFTSFCIVRCLLLGVTSVEVKGVDKLEVKGGEFNKIAMSAKLKDIDESVTVIIKEGLDVHTPNIGSSNGTNFNMKNVLSAFRVPARVRVPPPPPVRPASPVYAAGRGKKFNQGNEFPTYKQPIFNAIAAQVRDLLPKANANKFMLGQHNAEILGRKKAQPEVKQQNHKGGLNAQAPDKKKQPPEVKQNEQEGGFFGFFGKKKQQPQKEKVVSEIPKPQRTSRKGTTLNSCACVNMPFLV